MTKVTPIRAVAPLKIVGMDTTQDAFDRLKSLYETANKDRIYWKQRAEDLQAENDKLRAILNGAK